MTLQGQIFDGLRGAMLSGHVPGGARLPATRQLALELAVSSNTVALAFDRLTAEGDLEPTVGTETLVRSSLSDRLLAADRASGPGSGRAGINLSRKGALPGATALPAARRPDHPRAFWLGLPDLTAFLVTI